MRKRKSIRVGFISRVDKLSDGYRQAIVTANYEMFERHRVAYVTLNGGLVSCPAFWRRLNLIVEQEEERRQEALRERKRLVEEEKRKPKEHRQQLPSVESKTAMRARLRSELFERTVDDLVTDFPVIHDRHGRVVKTFVVTSPARNYDNAIGKKIAQELSRRRPDIVWWNEESARFVVKGIRNECGQKKRYWVVLPVKIAWRSKYFSTRVDRLVEDKEIQTSQTPADLWVSDLSAASLFRPIGELSRPRVSFPASHRLQEITTAENQIGAGVVEFIDGNDTPLVTTWSLKDFVQRERELIPDAEGISDIQRAILAEIKEQPCTIGMLEDALSWKRATIDRALRQYAEEGHEPHLVIGDDDVKYDVSPWWLQNKLRFTLPSPRELDVDTLLGIGCVHAGYLTTQYRWFDGRVPEFVLEHDIKHLVGCGDYIAGLKHDLHLRGEIFSGMNYTKQHELAARMIGSVIFKVFRSRFEAALKRKRKRPDEACLLAMIDEALLQFFYWVGNHDKWLLGLGVDPIAYFALYLETFLIEKIEAFLEAAGLRAYDVRHVVRKHLVYADTHILPSGLVLGINHPEMARAKTSSLRAQDTLKARPECHVNLLANFHTAIRVEQWMPELGQRVALQVGTLVSETEFEEGKLKVVDTGVGILRIASRDKRIFEVETIFEHPRPSEIEVFSNEKLFDDFVSQIGI